MDELDRLNLCIKLDSRETKELAEKTKIERSRLTRTLKRQLRMSHEEFIRLTEQFPDFKYWIIFGEELPESGQISPMTKLAQEDYRKQEGD